MDKNKSQFKKKLSLFGKTLDHHLTHRLSPTKSQPASNIHASSSVNISQPNLDTSGDQADPNKPAISSTANSTDQDALGERIFRDFTNSFEKDGNVLEFDIIKVDDNQCNRSPVILVDHHLAIESWCVKPLYSYLYKQLLSHNKKELPLNDEDLKQKTRLMLLLNPSVAFTWNLRKTLVEDGLLSVEEDLQVSELVLKKKPKSPESFVHREWLLMYLHGKNRLTNEILTHELAVCLNAAHQYASNYYAWNHRYNIVNQFFRSDLNFMLDENELIKRWINNHISDYSGYHYKQMVLSIILSALAERGQKERLVELLNGETANSKKLFQIYPNQEALFCHKRYLLKMRYQHVGLTENDLKEEQEFVAESYNLAKKFDNNWLITMINRYVRWIEYNCKIQLDVK